MCVNRSLTNSNNLEEPMLVMLTSQNVPGRSAGPDLPLKYVSVGVLGCALMVSLAFGS